VLWEPRANRPGAVLGPEAERLEAQPPRGPGHWMGAACLRVHDVLEMAALAGGSGSQRRIRSQKRSRNTRPLHPSATKSPSLYRQPPFLLYFSFFGAIFEPQTIRHGRHPRWPTSIRSARGGLPPRQGRAQLFKSRQRAPKSSLARIPGCQATCWKAPGCGISSSGWMC